MPKIQDINKIMIIGSGPIIIGQACEFDYSELRLARHSETSVMKSSL